MFSPVSVMVESPTVWHSPKSIKRMLRSGRTRTFLGADIAMVDGVWLRFAGLNGGDELFENVKAMGGLAVVQVDVG